MDKQAGKAVAAMYNGGWVKKGNAMAFGNVPEWLERAMEGSRVHAKQFEPISLAADVSQRLLKDRNPAPEFVEAMKAVLEYFEARSAAPKYPAALAQALSNPLGVLARAEIEKSLGLWVDAVSSEAASKLIGDSRRGLPIGRGGPILVREGAEPLKWLARRGRFLLRLACPPSSLWRCCKTVSIWRI